VWGLGGERLGFPADWVRRAVCGLRFERKRGVWGGFLGDWGDLGLGAGVANAVKRLFV